MASDKLHLSKKWNTVFIHLAAWSILFIFPLLFIERFGNINRMHNFSLIKFYIQPICIACIFYINYLWLIDKVLFRKKTIRFILYNLLLVVMANIAIYLVHRMVIPFGGPISEVRVVRRTANTPSTPPIRRCPNATWTSWSAVRSTTS